MSTEPESKSFEEQVEDIYQQYRHKKLESRLEEIAETMEETVLQQVLADEFLQTSIEIDQEAKEAVQDALHHLENNEYGELNSVIDTVEELVEDQERRVSNKIHEERISMNGMVNGMHRLNSRVERVSEAKIKAIDELLDNWDWKGHVYRGEDTSLEARKSNAAEFGQDMRRFFEEARDEIFGPYEGTPIEPIVDDLLSDDPLYLETLRDDQIEELRESDLESYVKLSLS